MLSKNLVLEGPFSVETPDTSGETLIIAGADISDLQSGKAFVNTEHISPSDADKEDLHKKTDGKYKGFQSIIGRVLGAKKIFKKEDCSSDRELESWMKFQKPMIYGSVELFDGEDAHENSRAAASLARMFHKVDDGPRFGLSVEGSTLKRSGNLLERTVIRHMAGTLKPANRAATLDIVGDTAPMVAKSLSTSTTEGALEPLRKSIEMQYISVGNLGPDFGLFSAVSRLKKTLEAGYASSAPSSLTGGAALQRSSMSKFVELTTHKNVDRKLVKSMMPNLSDRDADVLVAAVRNRQKVSSLEKIYKELSEKKRQ